MICNMDVQILYSRNFGLRTSQQHSSVIDDRSISVTSASSVELPGLVVVVLPRGTVF